MNFILQCGFVILFIANQNCQYNVIRSNPFKQLTDTLKTFQAEGCDGGVIGLSCPTGTKVRMTLNFFYNQ